MPSASIELPVLQRSNDSRSFGHSLDRTSISTLQINIGLLCNLACNHCHVESSPARSGTHENMGESTARRVVEWGLGQSSIRTVDFTGGSPEMNPNFRWMVDAFREGGVHVMARCNPTIIGYTRRSGERGFGWVPEFYASREVEVVASLPCYLECNVNKQRGGGAFVSSIEGLRALNAVGYGARSDLKLNLVYNPVGATLPPPQASLEQDYKAHLHDRYGIVFNELWTITNMPIKRWRHELERDGRLDDYMQLLIESFNPGTLKGLMCRHQISVGPTGDVYDCDFNLALGLRVPGSDRRKVWELSSADLLGRVIATGDHCYGCAAGSGSSCGGTLV